MLFLGQLEIGILEYPKYERYQYAVSVHPVAHPKSSVIGFNSPGMRMRISGMGKKHFDAAVIFWGQ